MADFTAFDRSTRRILYSGSCADVSLLPHEAFEGVKGDGATMRVKADFSGIEAKPTLGAVVTPLAINAGESVSVTVPEPVHCYVDGELLGEIAAMDTIDFAEHGSYRVFLNPISLLLLPEEYVIEVT